VVGLASSKTSKHEGSAGTLPLGLSSMSITGKRKVRPKGYMSKVVTKSATERQAQLRTRAKRRRTKARGTLGGVRTIAGVSRA